MMWRTIPLVMILAYLSTLDSQYVTSVVGLVLTAIAVLLQLRPFSMKFYDHPIPAKGSEGHVWKIIECKSGQSIQLYIGMRLRWPRKFKTIDVRFVEKPWYYRPLWLANDVPRNSIRVLSIDDQQYAVLKKKDYRLIDNQENKANGREASYKDPIDCPFWGWMWYSLKISSDRDWNGYLSFEIRRGNMLRARVRSPICFKIKP